MNIKINTWGGGVFSKLNIAVDNAIYNLTDAELDSIDNIYLGFDHKEKYCNTEINMFDYIFEQNSNLCFDKTINCATNFKYTTANLNSVYSKKIKKVLCKLKIKTNILDRIPSYCNSNTFGVHVRLTDMLHCHPENCIDRSYSAYEKLMLTIISENNIKTPIFIASDNIESIEKLKLQFDILYIDTLYRNKTELDTDGSYLKKND